MPSETPEEASARVVLGVAGGIAAYKAVEVLRRLKENGFSVTPVLTRDATRFVAPLTFTALAGEPARVSLYDDPSTPIPHTRLGQSADVVVVAPATAHLIARLAAGLADDLLTATILATRAPVLLCPAMHTEMWEQPSVQENLATLRRRGVLVLDPDDGPLAGGDSGPGRLADPATITDLTTRIVRGYRGPLSGVRVLVSAGGTREAIDPVRVITNRSSGRQGHALATVAARLGADVTLVTASDLDVALDVARRVRIVRVVSASEMRQAVLDRLDASDVVIMAAAIADFTVPRAEHKLKKADGVPRLELTPTPDVLSEIRERRRRDQIVVGFAAESRDVVSNATAKLERKGVDLLVVNDVTVPGAGFEAETNEVTLLSPTASATHVARQSKEGVALEVLTRVAVMRERGDR